MQVRSGGRRQAGQVPSCFQWETPESNGGFPLPFLALLPDPQVVLSWTQVASHGLLLWPYLIWSWLSKALEQG